MKTKKIKRDITEMVVCAAEVPRELWESEKMMKSYDGVMFHKTYNCKDTNKKRKRKKNKKKGRKEYAKTKK